MAKRPKHPNKHIEAAIEYALENGWKYIETGNSAHAFCILRCIQGHGDHSMSVYSTPKKPEDRAKDILKMVKKCTPPEELENEENENETNE
ncbi:hypothetical protein [Acinetobacter bereziniae]|uniref:hypothetical protein n=1 Tax=Acinetobacter bereziniae TaxID=106648 RepID=UPI0030192628